MIGVSQFTIVIIYQMNVLGSFSCRIYSRYVISLRSCFVKLYCETFGLSIAGEMVGHISGKKQLFVDCFGIYTTLLSLYM